MRTDRQTVNQNTLDPQRTMISSTKSLLGKNEYMTIQIIITAEDPTMINQVITVQLKPTLASLDP